MQTLTHMVDHMGANDILRPDIQSLDLFKARALAAWVKMAGPLIYRTTLQPRTTSENLPTDSDYMRVGFNDWLRDGAPISGGAPAAIGTGNALRCRYFNGTSWTGSLSDGHPLSGGVVETADAVESARNSGSWRTDVDVKGDHTHPSAQGQILMADVLDSAI